MEPDRSKWLLVLGIVLEVVALVPEDARMRFIDWAHQRMTPEAEIDEIDEERPRRPRRM